MGDRNLALALRDITEGIREEYTGPISCARAIETIRNYFIPEGGDRKDGWEPMRNALNAILSYVKSITDISRDPRHGDRSKGDGGEGRETAERAWILMNRFLEYRKREDPATAVSGVSASRNQPSVNHRLPYTLGVFIQRGRPRRLAVLALIAALCLASQVTNVVAADITVWPADKSGRIFVDVSGDIAVGDEITFREKTANLDADHTYVSLLSDGGNSITGGSMGDVIRFRGMNTYVGPNATCTSICAFIRVAGRAIRREYLAHRRPRRLQHAHAAAVQ